MKNTTRRSILAAAGAALAIAVLAAPAHAETCYEQVWQPGGPQCSGGGGTSQSSDFSGNCAGGGQWVSAPVECPPSAPADCTLPTGETIWHGQTVVRYSWPGDPQHCDACRTFA